MVHNNVIIYIVNNIDIDAIKREYDLVGMYIYKKNKILFKNVILNVL